MAYVKKIFPSKTYIVIINHVYFLWISFYGFYIFIYGSSANELMNPHPPEWLKMVDEFLMLIISSYTIPYIFFNKKKSAIYIVIGLILFSSIILLIAQGLRSEEIEIQTLKNIYYVALVVCWLFWLDNVCLLLEFISVLTAYTTIALFVSVIHHITILYIYDFGYELPYSGARLLGAFSNPNTTGFCAVSNIVLLLINYQSSKFRILSITISTIALTMTLSVSAIFQFILLCFVYPVMSGSSFFLISMVLSVTGIYTMLYCFSDDFSQKINAVIFVENTVTARIEAYASYLSSLKEPEQLLLGIKSVAGIYYSDSAILNLLHDFGILIIIPYLFIFVCIFFILYVRMHKFRKLEDCIIRYALVITYLIGVMMASFIQYQILIMPSQFYLTVILYYSLSKIFITPNSGDIKVKTVSFPV